MNREAIEHVIAETIRDVFFAQVPWRQHARPFDPYWSDAARAVYEKLFSQTSGTINLDDYDGGRSRAIDVGDVT